MQKDLLKAKLLKYQDIVLDGYTCQMCENKKGVTQKTTLERAPIAYCFYVKDFGMSKAQLKYPETFDETVRNHKIKYELLGVLVHQGPNRLSGHFTTYIKSPTNKLWYLCDDETVKMSNWETVSKQQVFALIYQKQGDKEAADRQLAQSKSKIVEDQDLQKRIDEAHQQKVQLDTIERRKGADNTISMAELDAQVDGTDPKSGTAEGTVGSQKDPLGKRKPQAKPVKMFKAVTEPLSRLRKLKRFARLLPQRVEAEKDTVAVDIQALDDDPLKLHSWNKQAEQAMNELKQENRFMLGQIVRQRDAYDVEYDQGKVKKVKKQKQEKRFNFDKAEKKIKKLKSEGKYLPRKSRK